MATPKKTSVGRRGFLKGAAGAAAVLAEASGANAQKPGPQPTRVAAAPDAVAATENRGAAPSADVLVNERPGSDFMVEVIKSLGFEYCCANPGLGISRPARIDHQLRRQQRSRTDHVLP